MRVLRVLPSLVIAGAILVVAATSAPAATRTVCPAGCFSSRIQTAITASVAGDTIMVLSSYDAVTAGEVFPIQTLQVQNGPLTIVGEVNAVGAPATTIAVSPSPAPNNDAVILVSPGAVFKNFRIVGANGSPVNRVVAAGVAGGGFGNLHLQGLTIDNVVVDFRSTNFNARSGFDLIADDVTIKNSTMMGVSETYVFVDGDRYTIMNNTLTGLDASNVIRADIAIGFGADLKVPGGPLCAGPPLDYVITGNTIRGFLRGIAWCTGIRATVTNNVIQDIALGPSPNSGSAIETSDSQNVTIANNSISWTLFGGRHGIGVSIDPTSPFFQPCTGVVIANNVISGRPQRDVQRGVSVQGCTGFQVRDNTLENFGDVDGSIFVAMFPGQSTASVIEGNTVRNGNASGIVYLGADTGGTAGDHTMIVENTVQSHRRNGLIVSGVKGLGGLIGGNIVTGSNQGLFPNTHGLNLQNLSTLMLSNNQVSGTAGAGAGVFLANTAGVGGGCNGGTGNGGGFLVQVNVAPPFQNPFVNCSGSQVQLLPSLGLQLNQTAFQAGQTLNLWATLAAGSAPVLIDAYVLVRLPNGSLFSVLLGGGLVSGMVPIATGFPPFSFSSTLLSYTFNGTEPPGSYTFMGMLTQTGTLNVIGTVDQDPFTVGP